MLEIAQTQWLVRHDADDIAYPRRLEQTLEYIHKYPTAGMFYSEADYYPIKRGVAKFRTTKGDPKELYAITKAGYLLAICHPSVTLNIEKTRAVGGYRFNLYVEDIDLWWRMALAYDIRFIPEVTVGVRQNQASSSWQNLEQQAVNALYVQYLLLAALSNLGPHSYDEIYPLLYSFLDRRKFRLKKHLRDANIHLTETHYAKGLLYLSQAFFCSPSAFLQRIHYGLFPRPNVSNGEDPLLLAKKCGELWPEYAKLSLFRGNVQDDRSKCW
jgi:GT2 family glycosyltransferase